MKRFLIVFAILAGIDFLTPTIQTGAQAAIAPLIIAAIVSAVASAKASEDAKQAANAQAASQQAAGDGGGIQMESAMSKEMEAKAKEALGDKTAFATGAQGPTDQQRMSNVTSLFNQAIQGANNEGTAQAPIALDQAQQPQIDIPTDQQIPDDVGAALQAGQDGGGEGMEMMDKVAMAAQIGSLLRGPGAPPPPGRGGGSGINMAPVSLRSLYGKR